MLIKKYEAKTLEEIQSAIQRELGPQAVILTSRKVEQRGWRALLFRDQIEVVAAIDEKDWELFKKNQAVSKGPPSFPSASQPLPFPSHGQAKPPNKIDDPVTSLNMYHDLHRNYPLPPKESRTSKEPSADLPEMKSKEEEAYTWIKDLQRVAEELVERFNESASLNENFPTHRHMAMSEEQLNQTLIRNLYSLGLSREIIDRMLSGIKDQLDFDKSLEEIRQTDLYDLLKRRLAACIRVSGPISLIRGATSFVALVGGAGEGKTSLIIKLAWLYSEKLHHRVGIIGLHPAGSEIPGFLAEQTWQPIPFYSANTIDGLLQAAESLKDRELVLIDTFSFGCRSLEAWQELKQILSVLPLPQIHLAVNASQNENEVAQRLKICRQLVLESIIYSKLDEAHSLALIPNISIHQRVAVSHLSIGEGFPETIHLANADWIAEQILSR